MPACLTISRFGRTYVAGEVVLRRLRDSLGLTLQVKSFYVAGLRFWAGLRRFFVPVADWCRRSAEFWGTCNGSGPDRLRFFVCPVTGLFYRPVFLLTENTYICRVTSVFFREGQPAGCWVSSARVKFAEFQAFTFLLLSFLRRVGELEK